MTLGWNKSWQEFDRERKKKKGIACNSIIINKGSRQFGNHLIIETARTCIEIDNKWLLYVGPASFHWIQ